MQRGRQRRGDAHAQSRDPQPPQGDVLRQICARVVTGVCTTSHPTSVAAVEHGGGGVQGGRGGRCTPKLEADSRLAAARCVWRRACASTRARVQTSHQDRQRSPVDEPARLPPSVCAYVRVCVCVLAPAPPDEAQLRGPSENDPSAGLKVRHPALCIGCLLVGRLTIRSSPGGGPERRHGGRSVPLPPHSHAVKYRSALWETRGLRLAECCGGRPDYNSHNPLVAL